jgi:hypothetical protein
LKIVLKSNGALERAHSWAADLPGSPPYKFSQRTELGKKKMKKMKKKNAAIIPVNAGILAIFLTGT